MQSEQVVINIPYLQIFNEQNWHKYLPKKYLIKSRIFQIDQNDTQFLIDDCTKPNLGEFKINQEINQVILNQLNGQSFLKIYGRTAKDINFAMSKILNTNDLTMAIKMSQFLTQALDQELEYQKKQFQLNNTKQIKLKLMLRQYKDYLQNSCNQFRLYLFNNHVIAICQKVPNHISSPPNQLQIKKAQQIGNSVYQAIRKILKIQVYEQNQKISVIVDCFISETGIKAKIFSIDPINPLHCLSLFSQQELNNLYKSAEQKLRQKVDFKPVLKNIKSPQQYKEVDLSYYKVGWELGQASAFQEWKSFINGK